ncbi:MAG: alpha/beta fold hydrolase [Caulobacteraceae bacterium]
MPRLARDGVDLYYETHGEGPALLLSHAYGATSEMWSGQIEALSRDHTLIVWDMRGHGQSSSPAGPAAYSEAATVADMAALLDAAHAPRAIVGGLSLGGYMSLAFQLTYPERVRALLIVDTGPGYRNDEARAGWNARALRTAERLEGEGLAGLARAGPETRAGVHRSAQGLALAARGMLGQKDARVIDSLPAISVPTLVVVGANDAPFLAAGDYMAAKIPGAKKVVIADAGHAANIDQPEAFNAAVLGFLKETGL